jgi:glycosyltransferase involved in cell wall biosynthesis
VGGNPEAVLHEKTGFIIPPRDPGAIGDAFLKLAQEPELRRRYGKAARQRVEREFSLDRCVTAHAELYEELLARTEGSVSAHPAPAVPRSLDSAKAIRVTHVITGLGVGGSERSLLTIAGKMDPARFKTEIVVLLAQDSNSYTEARSLGLRVANLGMRAGLPIMWAVSKLVRHIRQTKPTILQTWLYHSDLVGLLSGRLTGTPHIVWNVRCTDVTQGSRLMQLGLRGMGVLSRFPDAIVVNSHQGRITHEAWSYRPRRWVEIGNCVDSDRFRPRPHEGRELRRRLGLPLDATIIGCVARLRDTLCGHGCWR